MVGYELRMTTAYITAFLSDLVALNSRMEFVQWQVKAAIQHVVANKPATNKSGLVNRQCSVVM